MKRIIICIMILAICMSVSACRNKISTEKNINGIPTGESQNSTSAYKIKPLEALDFTVTDSKNIIRLDSPYKEFKINKPEEKLDNNYVGETYSGEFVYKTYMHKYADFDLYVSNVNYNLKNRNFDDYYITQITFKNSNFKTLRDIAIGSKVGDINNAYGLGEKSNANGKTILKYKFNDMEMSFVIGENQKVQDIVLRIIEGEKRI